MILYPQVIASAARGEGVFETLKAILKECLAVVDRPAFAPAGHSPSIVPGQRASMYPEAEPGAELRETVPGPGRLPRN